MVVKIKKGENIWQITQQHL